MPKKSAASTRLPLTPKGVFRAGLDHFKAYWQASWWHKTWIILISLLLLAIGGLYGVARWYIAASSDKPLTMGVTFIPAYAESLGVNPEETMDALINDVGIRHFRLVSYWNQLEPQEGKYDFSLLDWQFAKAEQADAKVTLSIGARQPRWPECHIPEWAMNKPVEQWQPQLEAFMQATIKRYKDSPALESYQLENEALLKNFGECTDFSRDRLVSEYNLVKKTDSKHPVIMSRSNNFPALALGKPRADIVGFSVYRRIWDSTITKRYAQYPLPAWYYAGLAGMQKIVTGQDSVLHELQAEAWPPNGKGITEISLEEQNKSFNAERFADAVRFGKGTGMRTIDLWGAEYWYYRSVKLNDDSVWNIAKQTFHDQR